MGAAVFAGLGVTLVVIPWGGHRTSRVAVRSDRALSSPATLDPLPDTTSSLDVASMPPTTVPAVKVTTTSIAVPRPTTTAVRIAIPTSTSRPTSTTLGLQYPKGDACGTESGSGGIGAEQTFTANGGTFQYEIMPCHIYDGDSLQSWVHVDMTAGVQRRIHVDFGDGTTWDSTAHPWACDDPNRPNPYHWNLPTHTYTAPGQYHLSAVVTTASCANWASDHTLGPDLDTTLTINAYREVGPPPPP